MEFHSESGNKARDHNHLEIGDNAVASRARPNTRLQDILMSDKPALSYADYHHEITRNVDRIKSNSPVRQQSHRTEGKAKEDEMTRCTSKLPSYLASGKDFQEKPLNVGVLDWRHSHNKNRGYSSSTSSTSYISSDGSSSLSSRDHNSSPGPQRMYHSSSQTHLEVSPVKSYSRVTHYVGKGHSFSPARQQTYHLIPQSQQPKSNPLEGHSRDVNSVPGEAASGPNHMIRQKKLSGLHQTCGTNRPGIGLDTLERKVSGLDLASSCKGKLRIRENELKKEMMKSQEPNLDDSDPNCSKEQKTSIVLLIDPTRSTRVSNVSKSTASDNKISMEEGRRSFFQRDNVKELHCSEFCSRVPHSCPLPSKDDSNKQSEDVKILYQQSKSPSRSRNTVDKKLIMGLKSSDNIKLSGGSDKRPFSESSTKPRNPSHIRRLSSAMGSILRSAGSRENSPLRRSYSKDPVGKHELERAGVLTSSVESSTDKPQGNTRARSSPLRRLLDPLMKPKSPNVHKAAAQLVKKESPSTSGHRKSSEEQSLLSKEHPIIVKSAYRSGGTKGQESSVFQALLQVAVKNGLPLFTFAVDNDTNILAATLSKLSTSEKICSSWIYTFFNVHEVKRKSGIWLNQGTKGNGHSYVPNVIAQMKVTESQFPVDTGKKGSNGDSLREFNLFSVDVGQVEGHATEFQPANDLAAIVVKIPQATARNPRDKSADPSHASSRGCTTLILPGGVHTIPSKGLISTLTQRWRLGGSCDCGGWDVGCQLRIFTNQGEPEQLSSSSKTTGAPDEFKLFSRGQESQLVLRLNPFKDRMYSVGFDSSISLLQAFATCVSVLDCRGPSGFFDTSNLMSQGEVPASHVSYPPPHSPVERV